MVRLYFAEDSLVKIQSVQRSFFLEGSKLEMMLCEDVPQPHGDDVMVPLVE